MHQHLKYYVSICILTICLCLAPLFITDLQPHIRATSLMGSLGYVLRTSVTIKVMVGISIGTTLPVMVDVFLDRFSDISFLDLKNTFVVVSVIIVFGTMYLSLNDQYYMAYLYACFYYALMIVTTSSILYSISQGVVATQGKLNPFLFLIQVILIAAIYIFVSLTMLFPANNIFVVMVKTSRILLMITFSTMEGWWFYSLWRYYQIHKQFGVDEMKETTYMVGELFFFVCHVAIGFQGTVKENFHNADENFLIMYYIVLIFCSIFMTVLPGRLLRKISEIKESLLRLKREFVRYVSHEIRSPLNVAHAGLEILKADLEAMGASLAILSLLDDIFSASNAAIEILNDMLHYEHMDSGTFKLELAVTPLLNVFAGRLEVYKYMALKKNINLRIEDQVQVSEYFSADGVVADFKVDVDVEEGLASSSSSLRDGNGNGSVVSTVLVLYIDRFRVEQVIRNLMSNAIKFTPEGGSITMRMTRVATASTSVAVGRPAKDSKNPIEQLEDDESVSKAVAGFLRFEVVDSGAGALLPILSSYPVELQPIHYSMSLYVCYGGVQGSRWRISRGCSTSSCSSTATLCRAAAGPAWGCGSARTWPPSTADDWYGSSSLSYYIMVVMVVSIHDDTAHFLGFPIRGRRHGIYFRSGGADLPQNHRPATAAAAGGGGRDQLRRGLFADDAASFARQTHHSCPRRALRQCPGGSDRTHRYWHRRGRRETGHSDRRRLLGQQVRVPYLDRYSIHPLTVR